MNPSVLLSALAGALLLPPLNALLLCAAGFALRRRRRRLGNLLVLAGVALLLVLSTRVGALLLVRPLENRYPPLTGPGQAQAIVVLGAGRQSSAPEYGHLDAASMNGLKRLEYGAWLHKRTGLPILVTGGSPDGSPESEAALMARVLQQDFQVQARWQEDRSNNTVDNAALSAAILKPAGIERVLLVTDAIHMPRAMQAFAATGLQATAAATMYASTARPLPTDYLPTAGNLQLSGYAMHEWIGMLWQRLRRFASGQHPPSY